MYQYSIGFLKVDDHHGVCAKILPNLRKDDRNMKVKKPWHLPTDTQGFLLKQPDMETNIENLNDAIVTALSDSQKSIARKHRSTKNL